MFFVRGIRGAVSVEQDNPEIITQATIRLLNEILHANPSLATKERTSV